MRRIGGTAGPLSWRWSTAAVTLLLGVACGAGPEVMDLGAAPTRSAPASVPAAAASPTRPAAAAEPTPADGPAPPAGGQTATDGVAGTAEETTILVYLTRGEVVVPVERSVARVPRIGSAALDALLAGPTADERAAGYDTQIPATTRLRGLTIRDGVAVADLSGDFESGGGTLGLTLRLAQVACTLEQFPTVDGVRFALDGTVVDVLSGDGLVVDEPVACEDYDGAVAG